MVGLSAKPYRDSHTVAQVMLRNGYNVIPVNPALSEVLGKKCYPSLKDIPASVDLVDIFRRSEFVGPIVDDAITIGAKAVWMQLGAENEEAARKALAAGLEVVMHRCWKVEFYNHNF